MRTAYWAGAAVVLIAALAWTLVGPDRRATAAPGDRDANAADVAGEGAGGPAAPRIGERCTVYLRGDASGAAFGDRVSDLGNLIAIGGTIEAADAQWLVVKEDRAGGRRYRLRMAAVLAVVDEPERPRK